MAECEHCGRIIPQEFRFCPGCGRQNVAPGAERDPVLGRTIAGKYLVEAALGSGSMGCVYRAAHVVLNRPVALKVLHPHLVANQNLVQRFMREARAASRLSHPNIVTLLDFGQDEDHLLYLVMELLDGKSLARLLEEGPLELARALRLSRQILLAVDEAHACGVVHRDLKPDNIIVLPSRQAGEAVKVVDFGIAQILGSEEMKLTATGLVFGTPDYLSPEQAGGKAVGQPSDIYSFGVILYQLVTGVLPFAAETVMELLNRHLTQAPPHPGRRAPERNIPEALSTLILQCLAKQPERRPGSAMELHEQLGTVLEALPDAAPAARPDAPPRTMSLRAPAPLAPPEPAAAPPATGTVGGLACASCGHPTPAGARFCGACGAATAPLGRCPACGAPSQPDERFCISCGAVLSAGTGGPLRQSPSGLSCACGAPLSATEPACRSCGAPNLRGVQDGTLEQLRKYIPQGVMDAILDAGQELVTQRREVTVLFADVSGFTSLSDGRDPEDVLLIMNQCFEGLVAAVHEQGGTVDKFIGDCVMAIFGVPVAHEDDPARALRAAFGMLASLEKLNRTLPLRFDVRIGINAGPVVAGAVGASTRLNYTVMGDTVNVAQRLQSAAEVGKILVSESVHRACRGGASFRALAPLRVKGKAQPMLAYEALRLEQEAVRAAAPLLMVGRARELQLLETACDAARQGRGKAMLITGEPGIGKTALLLHAAERLSRSGLRPHLIRARLHGGAAGTFASLLAALLGCEPEGGSDEVRKRLEELAPLGLDPVDQIVLAQMTAGAEPQLPPDTVQVAIATAVRRLLRLKARAEPTAVLIDDAHRLPERERVLLEVGAAVAHDAPLLLLVTDRTADLESWPHQRFERIDLSPLVDEEAERLVQKLAGARPLVPETLARIVGFAGGNPLFLEETVRLLESEGQLGADTPRARQAAPISVPDGLRPLVLARFDRLDATAKRALIYAAVIGRSFTLGLLSRLAGDAHTLSPALQGLCEQGLLERDAASGPVRLRFRHEVVREILYELVTAKTRRSIHEEVGTLLQAGAGAEAPPEEIARHLEQAGRDAEAADLWERAGNDRVARHELGEAARYLGMAMRALERARTVGMVRRADNTQRELSLKIKWAHALNRASQWDEARRVALEARQAAQQGGDIIFAARATRELACAAAARGGLAEADSLFKEAQQAALECGDLALAADLAGELGEVQERQGNLAAAMTTLLAAQQLLEGAGRRATTHAAASTGKHAELVNRIGRVALRKGDLKNAVHCFKLALGEAETAGDAPLVARVLGNLGQAQAMGQDRGVALQTLERALEAARRLGDHLATAKLLYNQARLHHELGKLPIAEAAARECFELSVEIGWREGEAMSAALLEQLGGPARRGGAAGAGHSRK